MEKIKNSNLKYTTRNTLIYYTYLHVPIRRNNSNNIFPIYVTYLHVDLLLLYLVYSESCVPPSFSNLKKKNVLLYFLFFFYVVLYFAHVCGTRVYWSNIPLLVHPALFCFIYRCFFSLSLFIFYFTKLFHYYFIFIFLVIRLPIRRCVRLYRRL